MSIELDDTALDISCTQTKHTSNESLEGENERVSDETKEEIERVDNEGMKINFLSQPSEGSDESEEGEIERVGNEKGETERIDIDSMKIAFLSQPSEGSIKWDKRREIVNAKRRLQYKLNPIGKRLINQQYYHSQPEIKEKARQRAREAYSTDPSPIKEKARTRAREAYSVLPHL